MPAPDECEPNRTADTAEQNHQPHRQKGGFEKGDGFFHSGDYTRKRLESPKKVGFFAMRRFVLLYF